MLARFSLVYLRNFASAIALTAGLAIGATAPGTAAEMTKLTVVLSYVPDVESFGPEYAFTKGFFKDEGLDVTIIPAGNGIDQVQMVAAGTADIGITSPESIIAGIDKGEAFKVFAAEFQKSPVAMTCRKDSGVEKATDLNGKRLGVKARAKPFAELFMKKNGIDASTVEQTSISNADISVLVAGRIDCMITTFAFNEPMLIEQAGVPVNVLPLGDYGLNAQTNAYFTKAGFFDDPANEETLVKYLRAEQRAWVDFFKDPKAAAKFMVDSAFVDGLDLEQQTYQAEQQVAYMTDALTKKKGIMWLNPATWAETAANAKEAGVTKEVVDTSGILSTAILEKVSAPLM